ncbi:hypothetical protein CRE_12888 [Caenorhabditis remanei]|uniref:Solute carrier organic anion transporter family member n=1 Tax=Caenorhabditis remanei TaxID=31234 RepID=E3MQS8_CAERE|nr:hypothetical protein CRE_12888 [Caenorhabditis remanei]
MISKITWFFIVFGTVYFLESIGGFYMTSAVVFIEKQFQIPSRLSGTMVSAGDFAYIPVVIFTSYFGGKGNRARWIGAGCILISIANFMIASSNFLFPVEQANVTTHISSSLAHQIDRNLVNGDFNFTEHQWLEELHPLIDPKNEVVMNYEGDEKTDLLQKYVEYCYYNNGSSICERLEKHISEKFPITEAKMSNVRAMVALPYGFCHSMLNLVRQEHYACKSGHSTMGPFMMIFGGLLVLGVGRTMPFSLGLPLMDDNVKKQNLPLYFSFMFFVKILGPVIGLLVGGQLNKLYVDFNPPQGLTPLDPMWIGCWWLGFLIFGTLLFGPSLVLYCFPSDDLDINAPDEKDEDGNVIPKKRLNLVDRHIKKDEQGNALMPETVMDKVNDFKETITTLVKNKIFVGAMFGRIIDVLAFKGYFVFQAKYLELQFGVPQYRIQRYIATTGIVGFACGVMLGSFSMKFFKLQGRKAAAWVAVCSLIAALVSFANGTVGCKSVIGQIGDQIKVNGPVFDGCRDDCMCDNTPLYPVCDVDGNAHYSPCHAGCAMGWKNYSIFDMTKASVDTLIFENCACVENRVKEVSRSYCKTEVCEERFGRFFMHQAFGAVFGGLGVVPGMLIVLRAVPPEHRSVSLGFNGFLVSLLATLPSPIIWGKIIDMSCLLWQKSCDSSGSCQVYDTDELRVRLHVIYGCLRIFSLISDVWVWFWASGLKLIEEVTPEDEEKKEEEEKLKPKRKESVKEAAEKVEKTAYELDQLIDQRGS